MVAISIAQTFSKGFSKEKKKFMQCVAAFGNATEILFPVNIKTSLGSRSCSEVSVRERQ